MFRLVVFFVGIYMCCAAYAETGDNSDNASYVPQTCPVKLPVPPTNNNAAQPQISQTNASSMPLLSINADTYSDMNMAAALDFADPQMRPAAVTLPMLSDYPIDNLEIKLRVLKLRF